MVEAVAFAALVAVVISIVMQRRAVARLEDRVITAEMKIRCAELLPAGHDAELAKLSPRQIAALSLASDDQLGRLLDRAVRDQLTPDLIRKAIK